MQYLISGSELLEKNKGFELVGRETDMARLTSVLMRNKAASVILVGPGGVGVSALIMGLQALKDKNDTPFDIISKRIFWLKTDELFSSGNTDEISKNFKSVMNILKRTPDSILVIEDGRDFIEAMRNSGTSHFINILNSLVKANETQVIIEVRDPDIDVVLSAHSDMRQCYTIIDMNEPSGDELEKIVLSGANSLARHHKIRIEKASVLGAIELTTKYRSRDSSLQRAQPERAINLIDRALSTYRLSAHSKHPDVSKLLAQGIQETDQQIIDLNTEFEKDQQKIRDLFNLQRDAEIEIYNLEEKIEELKKESPDDQEVKEKTNSFFNLSGAGGFETSEISALRSKIRELQAIVNNNKAEYDRLTTKINLKLSLSKDTVYEEFSRLSGIPVSKLNENEKEKLRNLESNLNSRVFGQEEVIEKIANAIKVSRIGRRNGGKPQASFLIMGPSGTGKTEVCKALSHALKDDEGALTRFDMSEYMEKHSVAKLIGAPAGYEGSERGGILTNAMRQNPHRIILFDEIEKADPSIFDLFLQILSDGRLTDNYGRTVSFSESIVIMTTNIGQTFFLDESLPTEKSEELANIELDSVYRPEFLNRFAGRQNIVCFNRLELDSIAKIVKRDLNNLCLGYKDSGIELIYNDKTVDQFCKDHYQPKHGARGLQGYIVANIEPLVVNMILDQNVSEVKFEIVYNEDTKKFNLETVL